MDNNKPLSKIKTELIAGVAQDTGVAGKIAVIWLVQQWPGLIDRVLRWFVLAEVGSDRAYFDWDGLVAALDGQGPRAGYLSGLSGGEVWAVEVAVSLAMGRPCAWDMLFTFDHRAGELVSLLSRGLGQRS